MYSIISGKKSGRDKEKSTASNVPAKEEHLLTQNSTLDLDSFDSDVDSDDYENTDDKYGAMIWRLLEQENDGELSRFQLVRCTVVLPFNLIRYSVDLFFEFRNFFRKKTILFYFSRFA